MTSQPEKSAAERVRETPRVVFELPDGDMRQLKIGWSEWKDGALHLCVYIEGERRELDETSEDLNEVKEQLAAARKKNAELNRRAQANESSWMAGLKERNRLEQDLSTATERAEKAERETVLAQARLCLAEPKLVVIDMPKAAADEIAKLYEMVADLREELSTSRAAHDAALAQVPQWRPIETAPKDGASLLCWTGAIDEDGYGLRTLFWFSDAWRLVGDVMQTFTPTHWMPLPLPPKETT